MGAPQNYGPFWNSLRRYWPGGGYYNDGCLGKDDKFDNLSCQPSDGSLHGAAFRIYSDVCP